MPSKISCAAAPASAGAPPVDGTAALAAEQAVVRAEQMRVYHGEIESQNLAGVVVLSAIVFAVRHDGMPLWAWLPGLLGCYLVSVWRAWQVRCFRAQPESRSTDAWGRTQTLLAGLTGAFWALACTAMLGHVPVDEQLFILTVATVSAATSASGGFAYAPPSRFFMLLLLVPQIVWLLQTGSRLHEMIALLLSIFIPLTIRQTSKRNQVFIDAQRLRFRNEALARDLAVQRDVAEQAARAKSEFLANMSHEIRTPLNAILGFAHIGLRTAEGPVAASCAQIREAGQHLLGVINDILDYSKIEAGKLGIEQAVLSVPALLQRVAAMVTELVAHKGLRFELVAAPELPVWVQGDALRLQQILVNLLSNAVKFTQVGTVRLEAQASGGWLRFAVHDTGIGLSPEQIGRLFQAFEQADSSTTRRFGGTGLGLSISQRLAGLMGGGIEVSSRVGEGSCFTLQVPLCLAEAPAAQPEVPLEVRPIAGLLHGVRVLAAEDVEANRLILADLLEEAGAECTFAEHGGLAVAAVRQHPGAFDVVLMDVQMPVMDGFEATRQVHALCPELPVIGLTAHALSEDRAKCLACGMVEHITKPVDAALLIQAMRRILGQPAVHLAVAERTVAEAVVVDCPVDWAELSRQFRGKQAFILKLARTVLEGHAEDPARLQALADAGDLAGLAALAHAWKGLCGNLAAHAGEQWSRQVETAARAGDLAVLIQVPEYAVAITAVLAELAQHLALHVAQAGGES